MIPGSGAQLLEAVTVLFRSPGVVGGGGGETERTQEREFRTEEGGRIGQKENKMNVMALGLQTLLGAQNSSLCLKALLRQESVPQLLWISLQKLQKKRKKETPRSPISPQVQSLGVTPSLLVGSPHTPVVISL